jgi:hypothetical protein
MKTMVQNELIRKNDYYEVDKTTESWKDERIDGLSHSIVTFHISDNRNKIWLTDSQAAEIAKAIIMNLSEADAEDVMSDLESWQEG